MSGARQVVAEIWDVQEGTYVIDFYRVSIDITATFLKLSEESPLSLIFLARWDSFTSPFLSRMNKIHKSVGSLERAHRLDSISMSKGIKRRVNDLFGIITEDDDDA